MNTELGRVRKSFTVFVYGLKVERFAVEKDKGRKTKDKTIDYLHLKSNLDKP